MPPVSSRHYHRRRKASAKPVAPNPSPTMPKNQTPAAAKVTRASAKTRPRRTQEERTREMRARLTSATLACLREYGYAATTISRIVQKAGVSRGAHVHHYASKAELFQQAAQDVLRQAYRDLGRTVLAVSSADDRLEAMMRGAWRDVFRSPRNEVFLEFLVAARADAELARFLHPLAQEYVATLRDAAEHYLEPVDPKVPVSELIMMTQWLFRGMALDLSIAREPGYFERVVDRWVQLMGRHLKARRGVAGPPPRPPGWDPVPAPTEPGAAPKATTGRAGLKPSTSAHSGKGARATKTATTSRRG
jgi:AcrR family transcriptional regulator